MTPLLPGDDAEDPVRARPGLRERVAQHLDAAGRGGLAAVLIQEPGDERLRILLHGLPPGVAVSENDGIRSVHGGLL
ncbi:hypothetical protein WME73_23000 [Sorangium sp. So ce302]|uniref:hypothetical protein n=1 Tax=Sorangium sp. So ce302 TaxID=3133297 RepID=UPI003F63C38E